jgi:hypothetical protein
MQEIDPFLEMIVFTYNTEGLQPDEVSSITSGDV